MIVVQLLLQGSEYEKNMLNNEFSSVSDVDIFLNNEIKKGALGLLSI